MEWSSLANALNFRCRSRSFDRGVYQSTGGDVLQALQIMGVIWALSLLIVIATIGEDIEDLRVPRPTVSFPSDGS